MRPRAPLILPLLLAIVIAAGIGGTQFLRGADAAGAVLSHPSADCSTSPAGVDLSWTPAAGANGQRLDVSLLDNGFEDGTYTSVNLPSGVSEHSVSALDASLPHYWRVVSLTTSGEIESDTRTFVACGAPFLLWGPLECRGWTSATVMFHWSPVADYEGEQYIEFDSNGDWTGDDHWEAGPFSPSHDEARRSGFADGVGYLFRIVREVDGERVTSSEGWFMPNCSPDVNPNNYGTDDRLVVPAINVNAPVNIRDVGIDGVLGTPSGGYDVVKYNFAYFPNLQGQIGGPGPVLIAGHLDYYVIGPAVFWDLAKLKAGDVVEYWDGDVKYSYVVDWVTAVPFSQQLNEYIQASGDDTLLLVTCYGEFDRDEFGGYNQRTLIHTTRIQQ